jgi:two-component system phosphate regulon sensor histidine kinase PhoR
MVNLLQNAIRFTEPGGLVEVKLSADSAKVTVAVQDSGPGISKSHLPHIFERFYKADRARSGEGIVKHTVQAHGGSVFVESEVGRGSTFGFTLPLDRH